MGSRYPKPRSRHGVLAAGFCLLLTACDNPWTADAPSLDSILSRGWLFGDSQEVAPPSAEASPLYCYKTIGVSDCFDAPLDDGGNRLVGFQGAVPAIDAP